MKGEAMNMKHDKFSNHVTRKCVDTWTLDNNYRVKVYTYHDKVKKAYWSVISECTVEASGDSGIYFERHRMHEDLNRLAGKVIGTRYNPSHMEKAHEAALDAVRELVDQLLQSNYEMEGVSA
jgi:hypothetical protein